MDIYSPSRLEIVSVVDVTTKADNDYICYGNNFKYNELVYVVKGGARVVIDSTVIYNKPGEIVFIPKGECSDYRALITEDEECIDIFFNADFPVSPSLANRNFFKNAELHELFAKIYRIWQGKKVGYYNKCMSLFYQILSDMEVVSACYLPRKKSEKLDNAVDYIHAHYSDCDFDYGILPSLCGISYTYFKKLFVNRFCMTPSEYVRRLRMKRACELLLTGKFSVTQTALLCGFRDVYYFSKFFKKHMGISPGSYVDESV